MKKEAKLLLKKAVASLVLSVELFNRPSNEGRLEGVLIFLDHAFEMLLKAAIIHQGGAIREKRSSNTIGFDTCVRRGISDGSVKFLTEEQALTLQAINSLRDAAQHHLLELSEQHLYMQAQAGLTLFVDLYASVFGLSLRDDVPERVLPVCSTPPCDLISLFSHETDVLRSLLSPGSRKQIEALCRLRSLAILDQALLGQTVQPSETELRKIGRKLAEGADWQEVFPGVASINITSTGYGPTMEVRITKRDGIPIQVVPEGTGSDGVVAVKRVDELSFYSLGRDQIAGHIGLSGPKTTAVIWKLRIQEDIACFKQFAIGRQSFARYSQKALEIIRSRLSDLALDDVWKEYQQRNSREKG